MGWADVLRETGRCRVCGVYSRVCVEVWLLSTGFLSLLWEHIEYSSSIDAFKSD
jgi:hypothetical protein